MAIYARVDASGIVRCGHLDRNGRQTCNCRFGHIAIATLDGERTYIFGIDHGWRPTDGAPGEGIFSPEQRHTLELNTHNLWRYREAEREGRLETWRGQPKKRSTTGQATGAAVEVHRLRCWIIVCPDHGEQVINGPALLSALRNLGKIPPTH